jgi:uncharacterized membrane protein YraQ (UPF0718 family)
MGSKIPGKVMKNKIFFVAVAIYIVLAFTSTDNLAKSLGTACYYLVEMIQIMPVVFILTALIDAWIPQQVISRRLGSRAGFMGNVFALILGSLSAGPIYAAFPICKILLKKGTSLANISIILGAWAVVKVPMLLNEIKFIGVDFMIVRWIFTVIAILVMGHILGMLVDEKDIPPGKAQPGKAVGNQGHGKQLTHDVGDDQKTGVEHKASQRITTEGFGKVLPVGCGGNPLRWPGQNLPAPFQGCRKHPHQRDHKDVSQGGHKYVDQPLLQPPSCPVGEKRHPDI